MAERIRQAAGGSLEGKTVAVLGLAFKPNTDDMRDAPSLVIVPALQKMGASIRAFDPEAMAEAKNHFDDVAYTSDAYEALDGADIAVILTEWNEFRALDLKRVASQLSDQTLVDLRNIYRAEEVETHGLDYHSIGRPRTGASPRSA